MQSRRKAPGIVQSIRRLLKFHQREIASNRLALPAALTVTLIVCTAAASAQTRQLDEARIVIEPDHLVAADSGKHPLVEPHLAARPGSANQFLAAAIVDSADSENADCAAFASADGGKSWKRHNLGLKDCADPWVLLLEDGTGILTVLGNKGNTEDDELLVFRSPDGGISWPDPPVSLGQGHDHETMTVDLTNGPRRGTVYVASQQAYKETVTGTPFPGVFLTHSHDEGKTFTATTRVFPSGLNLNVFPPAVLSDGSIVVPFADFQRPVPGGMEWLSTERSWVLRSSDGGEHFSPPFLISESCGRGFPSMTVDSSTSVFRDRLYWLCHDYDWRKVFLHSSSDHGMTWSRPVQVNQSGTAPLVRTPAMAVNKNGVLGVAWYDGREDSRGFLGYLRCQSMFFTSSFDGGRTFLPEVKVSTEKSCPDSVDNGMAGKRFPAGGDYHGMVALPDGDFVLLWSDSRSGVFQLRTTRIKVRPATKIEALARLP